MLDIFKHTTVEPSLFIFYTVDEWLNFLNTNLYLQKSCRLNQTTEPDLSTPCDDEKRGILFVSEVGSSYLSVVTLICMAITIFATSWSDEAGRKRRPFIFIPILGQILCAFSGCIHSNFWQWTPNTAVLWWALLTSVSGGLCLMVYATQVYVCDISDTASRTLRLGVLGAIRLITAMVGSGSSGYVLRSFGLFNSYVFCAAVSACGLILGLILIKDRSVQTEKRIRLRHIFNLNMMIIKNFKVVFKKDLGRKRVVILLLLVANEAVVFTVFGEMFMSYPYLRYRFKWDERKYSDYMLYKFSSSAIGILFCSIVLSKRLKIHDGLIGTIAASFDTLAIVGLLLATQVWQLYLIPLIDLFHNTAMTVAISCLSKFYNTNEMGRLHAAIGVLMLFTIPFSFPAYNAIFQRTLDTFPSAFCLLSAVLDIVIVICYAGAYVLSKKFDKEKTSTVVEEETRNMITLPN